MISIYLTNLIVNDTLIKNETMAYSPVSALCLTYNSKSKVYPSAEMECSALVRSRISYAY